MYRIPRDAYQMFFDREIEPVLRVLSGDTVIFEAEDAHCGAVRSSDFAARDVSAVFERFGGLNPVTGPVYVDGASSGGCLTVRIDDMEVAPEWGKAYSSRTPEGALEPPYGIGRSQLESRTVIFDIDGDELLFPARQGVIRLPVRPMVGTIGVAPRYERRMSFAQGVDFLGNVDIPDLGPGATVILPVHHDGGLLSLGDCHARQGDGEISAGGIEIQANVTTTLTALSRDEAKFINLPQLNTQESLGSVAAYGGVTLADVIRAAYTDLVLRLATYYGFSIDDAYELLGHAGSVQVGTMCDPDFSALAKIDRRFVE